MNQMVSRQARLLEYLRGPLGKQVLHRETEEWSKAFWLERRVAQICSQDAENPNNNMNGRDLFTMILPPPNITGNLHLGHALTVSLQDAIVRHQLMSGKRVQWTPGFDHAGLSTQTKVESKLWQESQQTRHTLGKDKFLEAVNQWKEDRINDMRGQLDRFGLLFNYDREYFTMDQRSSRAVNWAFIKLYQDKLLYRELKPVYWSSFLRSTLSDIEVSRLTVQSKTSIDVPGYSQKIDLGLMYKFAYRVIDSANLDTKNDEIVVATTRIETMLGDVAIAVNPNDTRYQKYIGRKCIHPITKKELPIIGDESVSVDKGTGALKITPFVDDNDWDMARRHNLPIEKTLDESGTLICPDLPRFHGMRLYDARAIIIQALSDLGLFKGYEDCKTSIPVCLRTGDILDKRPLNQWFINCNELARNASRVVKLGQIDLVPENYINSLSSWLVDNGVKDWCISRQSWWGHRIPAYKYVDTLDITKNWVAAFSQEEARQLLVSTGGSSDSTVEIYQDNDVLDTWFSSSLLPFSIYDWPGEKFESNRTKGLFPLTLMETGFDILNYWVSRMIMMSLHLTGEVPFKKILLHGMVCDERGKKMSKSLGNIIDPIDIIDGTQNSEKPPTGKELPESGPDVLRTYLLSSRIQKEVIKFRADNLIGLRKFTNKIWNNYRFILPIIESNANLEISMDYNLDHLDPSQMSELDTKILSEMAHCVNICESAFANMDQLYFGYDSIYKFWTLKFSNHYVEKTKYLMLPSSNVEPSDADLFRTLQIQVKCLTTLTRLLHPYMPHLTEFLYQKLRIACLRERVSEQNVDQFTTSICFDKYPTLEDWQRFYTIYQENYSKEGQEDSEQG